MTAIEKNDRRLWADSCHTLGGKNRPEAVNEGGVPCLIGERLAMSGPLPLSKLLDEWYQWAEWISSEYRDESKSRELTGWFDFNCVVEDDPELAWKAIVEAIDQPRMEPYLGHLAAGPLENLLTMYGPAFIDRVEQRARSNAKFSKVLGGVWQSAMPEPIWKRVRAAQNIEASDGNG